MKIFKSEKKKKEVLQSYNQLIELWKVKTEEIDVMTEYGKTHCIIAGDKTKPPLLMFHGVGDNSAVMWLLNIDELSKYFYCIAIDTIGGPGKSIPNDRFTKQTFDQIKWIDDIIVGLELTDVNILGISNGGYMAYNYLTHRNSKIRKVVCLEGGMVIGNPVKQMMKTLMMMFPQILFPNKKNMIAILKKLSSPESGFIEKCPEVVNHMIMVMKAHNQSAMMVHKLEKYDKEKGRLVKHKVLFLLGSHGLEEKREFVDVLDEDGFKYKIIKGAGHGINHEQPERTNDEIIKYIIEG